MRPATRIVACFLVLLALCEGSTKKTPYGGSSAVYCNPAVVRQMQAAWMADADGTLRDGTWEMGFRVDYAFGQIQVGELVMGDAERHITIMTNGSTIAIVHVHPIKGVSPPSDIDLAGKFPDYVISKDGLYVTNPRTHTYQFVRPFVAMFVPWGCPAYPPSAAPQKQTTPQHQRQSKQPPVPALSGHRGSH